MKTETEQMIRPPDEEDIHRNYLHPAPITASQFAFLPLHLVIYLTHKSLSYKLPLCSVVEAAFKKLWNSDS